MIMVFLKIEITYENTNLTVEFPLTENEILVPEYKMSHY